ncbi:hypothetical protein [Kribbella sp. C-35]
MIRSGSGGGEGYGDGIEGEAAAGGVDGSGCAFEDDVELAGGG